MATQKLKAPLLLPLAAAFAAATSIGVRKPCYALRILVCGSLVSLCVVRS